MRILEYDTPHNIRAFSTYRGEGSGNYDGFNITGYCGDTDEHVAKCRTKLCSLLGIEDHRLILPRQTHKTEVLCIDNTFINRTKAEQTELLYGIDAIITDIPHTCIGVSTADCIPVLLYDETRGVIAAVHAGWRGTVARIVQKCISIIKNRYSSDTSEIKAIIAPGISIEAFEIGDEVYKEFADAGFTMEAIAKRYKSVEGHKKWHIDLWEANRLQMIESGIRAGNITITGICTYEQYDNFFSARRLGINSGRIFNGIMKI